MKNRKSKSSVGRSVEEAFKATLKEAATESPYDALVEFMHNTAPKDIKDPFRGSLEDFVDFIAEILNGGVDQYSMNSSGRGFPKVLAMVKVLARTSPIFRTLHGLMNDLDPTPGLPGAEYSEDENPTYEDLESWLYKDANLNALCKEALNLARK